MGLLDKLKPVPRWKHADPAVRLAALRELTDPVELAIVAETDADARVRRATIAQLTDPAVIGRLASGDADEETRDRAAERLVAIATNGGGPEVALAAARCLTDPRRLSVIARSDAAEMVCADALGRLADERALGSLARHAKHESIARAALDRVTHDGELLEVALNGEHRDVALAAFERVVTVETELSSLRSIESRTQQKAVSRRARAIIIEREAAEAARLAAEEEHRRQIAALCESVEQLSTVAADVALLRAELTRLSDAWTMLRASDEAMRERFGRGVAEAQSVIARREREAEEAAEHARQRAESIATRSALCARVETLDVDASAPECVEAQLNAIEQEWRSLMPIVGSGPEAERLAERFAQAVAACRKRHEMRTVLAETRVKLDALVLEAEGLPSQDDETAASARWQALGREARGLTALLADASRPADDLAERLAAVGRTFAAREAARRDAAARAQQEVVSHLRKLAERARRVAEADTITLREGDRLMRDIGSSLEAIGRLPSTKDIDEAAAAVRAAQEQVAPRVRELREMDDWRRFANAQRQEQLIAMAEAIVASLKADEQAGKTSDLPATARALRELHTKWQDVAEAPRNAAQKLWDRFRTATDFIRSRCEGYFAKLREERSTNLQQRTGLVEEAEALAKSTDWVKAAARFQELQTAWQDIGPVPRDAARDLAQRFRTACNEFFTRRREDLTTRKKVWSDNLARKEALCARAEELASSTDWAAASADIKRMQSDWKTIGPVRRSKSEEVWNRFRAAADRFFERYHNRHQITFASKLAEREALVVELETLVAAEGDAPEGLADRVQQLRSTWNRSVPIPSPELRPIADRWQAAFARTLERWPAAFAGTDLDPAAILQRMERLVVKIEGFVSEARDSSAGLSQAEVLAARLRSALATNAMGGRVNEDAKWRAAADAVKDAQASWQRLVPIASPVARALESRFREACRRVTDHARRHAPPPAGRSQRPHAAAM
jgi:hypothetical protein